MHADELLAGPRGRRLCFALLPIGRSLGLPDDDMVREKVARHLEAVFSGPDPEAVIVEALSASVSAARYWQDPDEEDLLLADPEFSTLLRPVADAICRHPSTQWWSTSADVGGQVYATPQWTVRPLPFDKPVAETLRDLHAQTMDGNDRMREHRRSGGEELWAMTSGTWWTPPIRAALSTTRTLPTFGPVCLSLREDAPNYDEIRSWAVSVPDDARVLEVDGVTAWADLVRRYPIDVTFGRGANWLQATRRDGAWAIPDWQAVSADYDAVHLTVAGYLSASGRVIDIDRDTASFIAGWNPDETYWLTDIAILEGQARRWVRNSDDLWEPSG